ncbi:MAG: tetratricopeptide repeat protein [Bradymonadaceae bacterium]
MGLIDGRRSAVALLVGDLASVAADELPWSSPEEFRHFAAGLSDILLDRACRAGAACVFVEGTDPQDRLWCDFLEQIAPQIEQRPVLVVLTCDSPDPFEPADYPGEIESVGVRAPRANEVENLVDDRYGDVVSRSVSRKVGDCVDGDVEVFRQLVERVDREAADGGEVRWRASSSAALLMRTVRSNLRARLDSIGDRRRAALGFAATFDGPFRLEWLTDPAFSGVELGDSDVDDFEDSGVFDVWRDRSGTTRAAFHSPVHREVLHRAQSDESVRDSDVRVVNELARRDPGDRLEWLESRRELARRLRQLGRFEASAKARRPLAQGLFDRYHCGEAIRVWKGAVADLDDRADVDLDDDLRVELLLAAARGHREVGDGPGAEALGRKLPSIRRLPDAVAFRALYEVGATFLDNDRLERAERAFERLQKRAAGAAAPGWSARAFHALSMVFEEREDQQAALRSLERAVERLEQSPELDFTDRDDRRLYWAPYNRLGTNYLTQGEMGRAKTVLERALKRAEAVEDARGLIRVRSNLGALYLNASDERRARDYFEEALAISERSGDVLNEARVAINLGVAAQRSGDLIESKERFERAHRLAKAISWEEGLQKMSPHIDKLQRSLA